MFADQVVEFVLVEDVFLGAGRADEVYGCMVAAW
jgi:hypothetical protein